MHAPQTFGKISFDPLVDESTTTKPCKTYSNAGYLVATKDTHNINSHQLMSRRQVASGSIPRQKQQPKCKTRPVRLTNIVAIVMVTRRWLMGSLVFGFSTIWSPISLVGCAVFCSAHSFVCQSLYVSKCFFSMYMSVCVGIWTSVTVRSNHVFWSRNFGESI